MDPQVPPLPSTTTPPHTGWWNRNWKWFVPTGCFSLILLAVGFTVCIVVFVFGIIKSSDIYQDALHRAQASEAVADALGTPIKPGLLVTGNTNANGGSGKADLAIPVSGPKGSGTIYAVAEKSAGRWHYETLEVEIAATKDRIELEKN